MARHATEVPGCGVSMSNGRAIVIAGAGAIGCYVGGKLLHAGHGVTFLGRPRVLDVVREHGLRLTDFTGRDITLRPETLTEDPACLAQADIILVTVKSAATVQMAEQIAAHARPAAVVVSLQNGVSNAQVLRDALPRHDVRAGMVPFNVTDTGPATWHRGTSGAIQIEAGVGDLSALLAVPGLEVEETSQIDAVQWGKLIINLGNAINALSGLTLLEQLESRDWRRLMADQMAEALFVLKAAGITPGRFTAAPAWAVPYILRLPGPLFRRIAARMLTIDPKARSSMQDDLRAGRMTEIDSLQGEVLRLAAKQGRACPVMTRITEAVHKAEQSGYGPPGLSPEQIRAG